jgi:hypothetical protein
MQACFCLSKNMQAGKRTLITDARLAKTKIEDANPELCFVPSDELTSDFKSIDKKPNH